MEEAALTLSSVSGDWPSHVGGESKQNVSEGRICTQCQKWRTWNDFHKKKDRLASRCKICVRLQKKFFRQKLRKKRTIAIENGRKFKCFVRGSLTSATINEVSQIFADAVRVTKD